MITEPREAHFITKLLNIILNLLSEFSEAEISIRRTIPGTFYNSVV